MAVLVDLVGVEMAAQRAWELGSKMEQELQSVSMCNATADQLHNS